MCMLSIKIGGCVIYHHWIMHNPLKQPITEHGLFMGIIYIYVIGCVLWILHKGDSQSE